MGYQTEFTGFVTVEPKLNPVEVACLTEFAETRHMDREQGPYYVGPGTFGVYDYNHPCKGQPGLWCKWAPSTGGSEIDWNGWEKFYDAEEWMRYLIDHFLRPGGHAKGSPGFEQFSFDHQVNGIIYAAGEESGDSWRIVVKHNEVIREDAVITYERNYS